MYLFIAGCMLHRLHGHSFQVDYLMSYSDLLATYLLLSLSLSPFSGYYSNYYVFSHYLMYMQGTRLGSSDPKGCFSE